MIEWWWLLVEAFVLIAWALNLRGWTWNQALFYAVNEPEAAREEIDRLGRAAFMGQRYSRKLRHDFDTKGLSRAGKRKRRAVRYEQH